MSEQCDSIIYDVIIVGGGLAGLLACVRIARNFPGLNILLVEKHAQLGGRLRSTSVDRHEWSAGLKPITSDLFNYWNQIVLGDPQAADLHAFAVRKPQRLGILQASKVRELPLNEIASEEGARIIAGGAAARDWATVQKLGEDHAKDSKALTQPFTQAFAGNKRSPAAVVLDHIAHLWGVPDIWSMQAGAFLALCELHKSDRLIGDWREAIEAMMATLNHDQVEVRTNCQIAQTDLLQDRNLWRLKAEAGQYLGRKLIVAVPPWEALGFLPRSYWPPELAAIATKTKPASLVILSEVITACDDELPDTLLVTAEDVQVQIAGHEITFQATLDFELTMQAPDVVKAIKRLKRARTKMTKAYPSLVTAREHLALVPVGWSQLVTPHDLRYLEKLADYGFQGKNLMFCGDAYGPHLNGDQNVLGSVTSVFQAMDIIQQENRDDGSNHRRQSNQPSAEAALESGNP